MTCAPLFSEQHYLFNRAKTDNQPARTETEKGNEVGPKTLEYSSVINQSEIMPLAEE